MSLLKFVDELSQKKTSNGQPIGLGRLSIDRMPYRGPQLPLKEGEFEQLTDVVLDPFVRQFDLSKADDLAAYTKVIGGIANGWYRAYSRQEIPVPQADGSLKMFAYVVWVEPWREMDPRKQKAFMR